MFNSRWWNKKIYKLRRNRLKWWQKYKESETHKAKYWFYQHKVEEEVKAAKSRLEERLARNIKEDRKGFFKYAKSKMKVKEGVGPIEDGDGNILRDEKKMAAAFSNFFKSVFTEEDTAEIPDPEQIFKGKLIMGCLLLAKVVSSQWNILVFFSKVIF